MDAPEPESLSQARQKMVEQQLRSRDIRDERVIQAIGVVQRHRFVPTDLWDQAYSDGPLPIGEGQTISQPYIVALMTQLLQLEGDEKVLEIGTGSGFQAAVLSHLAGEIFSVERFPALVHRAIQILRELEIRNVRVFEGDGSQGLASHAPFGAIVITAAAPQVPRVVLEQLADGGRLVIPVGTEKGQFLQRWRRVGDAFQREQIIPVAFVPLRGKMGWRENEWRT